MRPGVIASAAAPLPWAAAPIYVMDLDGGDDVDDIGATAVAVARMIKGEINIVQFICSATYPAMPACLRAVLLGLATTTGYSQIGTIPIAAYKGGVDNSYGTDRYSVDVRTNWNPGDPVRGNAFWEDDLIAYRRIAATYTNVTLITTGAWVSLDRFLASVSGDGGGTTLTGPQLFAAAFKLVLSSMFTMGGTEFNAGIDKNATSRVLAATNAVGTVPVITMSSSGSSIFTGPPINCDPTVDIIRYAYQRSFVNGLSVSMGKRQSWDLLPVLFAETGVACGLAFQNSSNGTTASGTISYNTTTGVATYAAGTGVHSWVALSGVAPGLAGPMETLLDELMATVCTIPAGNSAKPTAFRIDPNDVASQVVATRDPSSGALLNYSGLLGVYPAGVTEAADPTLVDLGGSNYVFNFAAGQTVVMPDNSGLDSTTLTIGVLFKVTSLAAQVVPIMRVGTGTARWGLSILSSGLAQAYYSADGYDNNTARNLTATGAIVVNTWYLAQLIYTPTNVTLFLNNVSSGSNTIPSALYASARRTEIHLGGRRAGVTMVNSMPGQIAGVDVRVGSAQAAQYTDMAAAAHTKGVPGF